MDETLPLGTVAVTGATGFLGAHLTRALVRRGCRPRLLARPTSRREALGDVASQVDWTNADLADVERLAQAVAGADVLFHLAGLRGRGLSASAYADANVLGTLTILEAASRADVHRVVLVGSAAEYGGLGPYHEDRPLRPMSVYGASKAAATLFALARHTADGLPVVVLRLFTVYGPGQPSDMFAAEAVSHAVEERPFPMSAGRHRQDLVYVDDVTAAFLCAAQVPGVEGRVINIGGGVAHTLADVARCLWRVSGTPAPLLIGALPAPQEDTHDTSADLTRARALLGWHPRTDLETGLRLTVAAARARKETA